MKITYESMLVLVNGIVDIRALLAGVDEKQVNRHVAGHMLHMFCETLKVTPIGAIVLLLEMSFKPTMGISLKCVSLVHGFQHAEAVSQRVLEARTVCKKFN
jgi:hypothetical protein